ncbi:hypothetical protein GCM10025868_06820 [Angustibacter aerolatus]|uniref:Transcriptional regulator MraZ n=1 Tax=Angustibacter aerolatus TaxID=1162965 RepID=A0ABQ6JCD2_9ACTN|nr:hypothetical protein GCM10025868_06820 [Angustibacter aerolatus]
MVARVPRDVHATPRRQGPADPPRQVPGGAADGLVVTRGQERCLYVFAMSEFERLADQMRTAPVTSKGARDYLRVFLSGASDEVPDKQGRVTVPPNLRQYAGLDREPGRDRCRVAPGDLGRRGVGVVPRVDRAVLRRAGRGGRPRPHLARPCGPVSTRSRSWRTFPGARRAASGWGPDRTGTPHRSPSSPSRADRAVRSTQQGGTAMPPTGSAADRHVPVLRDRVVDLLAPALETAGSVVVDGTLGMGGHAEALLRRCPEAVLVGIDRDEQALALAGERLAGFGERVRLVHAVFDELAQVLADLGLASVQGVLLDLGVSSLQARRGAARLRLPGRRAPRHADGPGERHHGRRGAEHLPRRRARPGAARLRRGAVRPEDRRRRGARARDGTVHDVRPAGGRRPRQRARRHPARGRQPGQAHLPGAADRGERRGSTRWRPCCPTPSTRSPWAAGSRCCRTTRSRTAR